MRSMLLFLLVVLLVGCGDEPGGTVSTLQTDLSVVTLDVGETRVIRVSGAGDGASPFSVGGEAGLVSTVVSATTIAVTGIAEGTATLLVSGEAGDSVQVKVHVYPPQVLNTGELLIRYVNRGFTWVGNDSGTGGDPDIDFFEPTNQPAGWFKLGSYADPGYGNPGTDEWMLVVKAIPGSDAVAKPTNFVRILRLGDSLRIWMPLAPAGYKAMGLVASASDVIPDTNAFCCVRTDLTRAGRMGAHQWSAMWDTIVSFAEMDLLEIPDPAINPPADGYIYLKSGTFNLRKRIISVSDQPFLADWPILHVPVPVVEEYRLQDSTPKLESHDDPGERMGSSFRRILALPWTLITDAARTQLWKLDNSPIYRLQREDYYQKAIFIDNSTGGTTQSVSKSISYGIESAKSTTYSTETSISVSVSGGVKLASVSTSLTYTFGYSSTSSTAWTTINTIQQNLSVAPGKSGVVWQRSTDFELQRNTGTVWEPVPFIYDMQSYNNFGIPINSFVFSEYPR